MELGHCPRCTQPYTTSEVVGFGILRARTASEGGPRVEYTCPGCGTVVRLIPYGEGRYAPPGEPPPAAVPEAARRPPWVEEGSASAQRAAPQAPPAPSRAPPPQAAPEAPPEASPGPEQARAQGEEAPMGPAEALEILGIRPSAEPSEIDRAFRERSLTCHPDKVAHLDPDFQRLAEHKFRLLRRAYEILSS